MKTHIDRTASFDYKKPTLSEVGDLRRMTAGVDDVGEVEGDAYKCSNNAAVTIERK
jgi:hypothetical protein